MSIQGVDYSWGRPNPAILKQAGFLFALRYLAPPTSGKVIGLAELQALHAAGLGVGLVWETYASRPLEGAAAGQADGVEARAQAKALGFPDGFPIFGAVDSDPPASEYPAIAAYLQAGGFDCYANAGTCQYMSDHGVCHHFWQHDWGGGTFADRHIHQRGQTTIGGAQVDINDAFETCCIWFPPSQVHVQSVPQPVLSTAAKEASVIPFSQHIPALDDQGNGNFMVPGAANRVVSVKMNGSDAGGYVPPPRWDSFALGPDEKVKLYGGTPHGVLDLTVWLNPQ
jgi:hypothetical protein